MRTIGMKIKSKPIVNQDASKDEKTEPKKADEKK